MEKRYQEQGEVEGLVYSVAITLTELGDRLLRLCVSSFRNLTFYFLLSGQVRAVRSPGEGTSSWSS